ncbi:polysaccharide deacetylase family protein [Alteribacillus sp. HJP-4]|uniref:polysaccharide deacetylase family protein n=1 Tax=Alteribacillus sp. HJP-4 TaxID=2775394 RepID=UPI0035CCED03
MNKHMPALLLFSIVVLLLIVHETLPYTTHKEASFETADSFAVSSKDNQLYKLTEAAAEEFQAAPQDAVIDKVWKAIPGYNGQTVDVKASYELMKKNGSFDEKNLVFEEISPQVHLSDLPPAPIYKGNPSKPMASLMINVSWGEEYLPTMLKTLQEENVKATFFLEGRWVQKFPRLAKMIVEEGHEIGSHAYSHPDLKTSTEEETYAELEKTNQAIEAVLSIQPSLFAPPSGSFSDQTVKTAAEMDMNTILWTADTVDWKNPDPIEMADRTAAKTENGTLVLMHPTAASAAGLKPMIDQIKKKQITLDTVSTLLDEKRIPVLQDNEQ